MHLKDSYSCWCLSEAEVSSTSILNIFFCRFSISTAVGGAFFWTRDKKATEHKSKQNVDYKTTINNLRV